MPFFSLFWDLIALIGLTWLFWYRGILWESCVIPVWGALSQAVLVFFGFQVFWILLREPIYKGVKKLEGQKIQGHFLGVKFELSPELLFTIVDAFHPRFRSKTWQLGLFLSLISLSFLVLWGPKLGLSRYSPFTISEFVPVVQSYTVFFPGEESPHTISPSATLQVASNQTVQITANILPNSDVSCQWTKQGGVPLAGRGCMVQYIPQSREVDLITLTVQSACKTQTAVSSLLITILHP